uniref:Uncharacterized protein n=2 Tax=Oryza brachyantha TaxID=4533 RepID=J3L0Q3_ORYBR
MDITSITLKGDRSNKRSVSVKEGIEYSQAAVSQPESSSQMKQPTHQNNEHEERPLPDLLDECMEKEVASSSVEPNQSAAATDQEDVSQKMIVTSTNESMHETEPVSANKIEMCQSDVPLKAEFPVGSSFVTPQKNKVMDVKGPKGSAEAPNTRGLQNKKGEMSGSVTGKAPTVPTKSATNQGGKNDRSVASGSTQASASSRKRTRKGWTTLKQIAEKEELERKEKMGNFVIPFFMQ